MADITEIIAKEAIEGIKQADKAISDLDKGLMSVVSRYKELASVTGAGGIKEIATSTKKAADVQRDYNDVKKKAVQVEREFATAQKKYLDQQRKIIDKEAERVAGLKLQVKSIADAERQNKALRDTIKTLDLTTKQGKDALLAYNLQINKNTEFIRQNSDAATRQRMNIGNYKSAISGLSSAFATLGAITAGLSFFKSSFNAFEESERASKRLTNALRGNTDAFRKLSAQAKQIQGTTGIQDEDIMQVQTMGAKAGKTAEQIEKITKAAVEWSALTGKDLQTAYTQINGTLTGTAGRLSKVDAEFSTLTKDQLQNGAAIDLIIQKYGGLAEASATESAKLKANWDEVKESAGGAIGTVINPLLKEVNKNLLQANDNTKNWLQRAIGYAANAAPSFMMINKLIRNIAGKGEEKEDKVSNFMTGLKYVTGYTAAMDAANNAQTILNQLSEEHTTTLKEQKSTLEQYIQLMEEQYARAKELEQFDVPQSTWSLYNAGGKSATSRGMVTSGGKLSRRATPESFGANDPGKGWSSEELNGFTLDAAQSISDATMQIIMNADQAAFDNKMNLLEKEKAAKLSNTKLTEKQRQQIEDEYEKKALKLKQDQFRKQKAADIIQSIINTALSVTRLLAEPPLAIAAGIAGAAQTAVIAAQPVPQFDKGVTYTPGTFIAGESRPEWMRMPSGQWRYIDRPTMFKNLAGATVIGGEETERMMRAGINPATDMTPAIQQMRRDIVRAIRDKRELHISARGTAITEREGNYYKRYFNKTINWAGK